MLKSDFLYYDGTNFLAVPVRIVIVENNVSTQYLIDKLNSLSGQDQLDYLTYLAINGMVRMWVEPGEDYGLGYEPWELLPHPDDGITAALRYRAGTDADRKAAAATTQIEAIYREQEIRTRSFWQWFGADRNFYAFIEEQYFQVLKPEARNAIDPVTSPIHYGLKTLSENGTAARAALQTWIDDPTKTAEDIAGFDVAGWGGWDIPRPV